MLHACSAVCHCCPCVCDRVAAAGSAAAVRTRRHSSLSSHTAAALLLLIHTSFMHSYIHSTLTFNFSQHALCLSRSHCQHVASVLAVLECTARATLAPVLACTPSFHRFRSLLLLLLHCSVEIPFTHVVHRFLHESHSRSEL